METSKRRDCDLAWTVRAWEEVLRMEWRPQKEGIATGTSSKIPVAVQDGMETSKRRDCDVPIFLAVFPPVFDGMETSKRRDCDHPWPAG